MSMIYEVSITIKPQDEGNENLVRQSIFKALLEKGIRVKSGEISMSLSKRSIDARHGQLKIHLRYIVGTGNEAKEMPESQGRPVDVWKCAGHGAKTVVIVGSGPAGLFGALTLLEHGIKPVIIERGERTAQRKKDAASISTKGIVKADSNYCFGEGGAGAFSDGKLYTRSDKRGDVGHILRTLVYFGADRSILTDARPHIGTDKLPAIVDAVCGKIQEMGGEIHFNTRCEGLDIESGTVRGVMASDTKSGQRSVFQGDAVMLATGHSASDVYLMLSRVAPSSLAAKTFAVGVRVEHPRNLIDSIQFHRNPQSALLHSAEYRLASQVDGRGVYSFCMCPGGFIVPSSTDNGGIVLNGMSSSARDSRWSNAAIVVETRPEDIDERFLIAAQKAGCSALAGLYFRTWLEAETKRHGASQAAPAQRLSDFVFHRASCTLPDTSYTPGVVASRLDEWLPKRISDRLLKGILAFNKRMRNFISDDALVAASETRTSSPVRIVRDPKTLQSTALARLYPAGEGAGYSGGIVSSAMDGVRVCSAIAESLSL